ncbi:WG repeat-containing protein [Hymenobacter gummosus]|uniref:WG repeat-containing protein n=1 Tax=Hymenobacter gummosus TaxID=1776032 RepID=A0A3S0J8N8_9BACT|nr:WG repeat-containing protein [Hymenobacter gummosus]RTQ48167.1 WG repeat-containing protein [Hymenobacter gummosus]
MRFLSLLSGLGLLAGGLSASQPGSAPGAAPLANPGLFPYVDQQKWGYLDVQGRPVVAPQFESAQPFAEGLGAVRVAGRYGYLNARGQLQIPATYDYATGFRQGLAQVWLDGRPLLINAQGEVQFRHPYAQLALLEEVPDRLVVRTRSGRTGLTDLRGHLLTDTVYQRIEEFHHGRALVYSLPDKTADPNAQPQPGVIDTDGRLLVPCGRYHEIAPYRSAVTLALRPDPADARRGSGDEVLLDAAGRELDLRLGPRVSTGYGAPSFWEGVLPVEVYTVNPDTVKVWSSARHYSYASLVDARGRLLITRPGYQRITPMTQGRAFAQTTEGRTWHLLDRQGRRVGTAVYNDIVRDARFREEEAPVFENGVAYVETDAGLAGIDTTGRVVVGPLPDSIDYDDVRRYGDLLVFNGRAERGSHPDQDLYGLWLPSQQLLVPLRYEALAPSPSFATDGLLALRHNGRDAYLNLQGQVVWQAPQPVALAAPQPLNLDYMNRAQYAAASAEPLARYAGYGGWGGSDNQARPLTARAAPPRRLSVQVSEAATARYAESWAGHQLRIANTTADTVLFDAQDSHLYLNVQARDARGQWQDIEYVPSSWCGNSYHTLFLAPGQYWQLTVPAFSGSFKTRLRVKLLRQNPQDQENPLVVYSNEFAGGVNPGQFWRKPGYSPAGLMDPYNE